MSAITWFPVVGCKFSMSHFQFWQILLTFNCRDTVMSHQTLILVISATFHLIDLVERGVQFWQIRLTSGCTDLKHSVS